MSEPMATAETSHIVEQTSSDTMLEWLISRYSALSGTPCATAEEAVRALADDGLARDLALATAHPVGGLSDTDLMYALWGAGLLERALGKACAIARQENTDHAPYDELQSMRAELSRVVARTQTRDLYADTDSYMAARRLVQAYGECLPLDVDIWLRGDGGMEICRGKDGTPARLGSVYDDPADVLESIVGEHVPEGIAAAIEELGGNYCPLYETPRHGSYPNPGGAVAEVSLYTDAGGEQIVNIDFRDKAFWGVGDAAAWADEFEEALEAYDPFEEAVLATQGGLPGGCGFSEKADVYRDLDAFRSDVLAAAAERVRALADGERGHRQAKGGKAARR